MQRVGNGAMGCVLPVVAVTVVRRAALELGLESLECAAALLTLHDALRSQIYTIIDKSHSYDILWMIERAYLSCAISELLVVSAWPVCS